MAILKARQHSAAAAIACALLAFPLAGQAEKNGSSESKGSPSVGEYFQELEAGGYIDSDTSSRKTLKKELKRAEDLFRSGSYNQAAVLLFAIVESPRYEGMEDFVEFQNSLYYLGAALAQSGAQNAALNYLLKAMEYGPSSLYFAPAHRKAVDLGLAHKEPGAVLKRLQSLKLNEALPPSLSGERSYLKAKIAYDAGELDKAQAELVKIPETSRLYSSALYLRGVIRTRKGELQDAADSFCEISQNGDNDKYSFVVDERYFRIKDLARLGLGRIAHESENYDNAYYHYFQIPEDSDKLADALFEASWSMYQKRELATARDLVNDFLKQYPQSPLMPEAKLLAGYIDLADCEFDKAQKHYDSLVSRLEPVIEHMDAMRKNPDKRSRLFNRALRRWRQEKRNGQSSAQNKADNLDEQVLALLRLHEDFIKAHEAVAGLRSSLAQSSHAKSQWRQLGDRLSSDKVAGRKELPSSELQLSLSADLEALFEQVQRSKQALRAAKRDGSLDKEAFAEEEQRILDLSRDIADLQNRSQALEDSGDAESLSSLKGNLGAMVSRDLRQSTALTQEGKELLTRLESRADTITQEALEKLYQDTRQVVDKARLGKIDSVIGQKRKLEIEVQDLASGRFPAELHGQLWEQGLIGDDEEFWPFEGEFWADEYEGWR